MHFEELRTILKSSPAIKLLEARDAPFVLDFLHRQFKGDGRVTILQSELHAALVDYRGEVRAAYPRALRKAPDLCLATWCSTHVPWLRIVARDGQDEPHYQLTPSAETVLEFLSRTQDDEHGVVKSPIERATDVVRKEFAFAKGFCPFYTNYRVLIPPDYSQIATIVPLDHDAVLPVEKDRREYERLAQRFTRELPRYVEVLTKIEPFRTKEGVLRAESDGITPYWPNLYFGVADAMTLTGIMGTYRPRRYVEIGSGHSTRFCHRARRLFETNTKITCIDPAPRVEIAAIADRVIAKSLIEVEASFFSELEAGDVLFLDGSHLAFHGSDVTYFFLRVLPVLRPGVMVHLHDVSPPLRVPGAMRSPAVERAVRVGRLSAFQSVLAGTSAGPVLLPPGPAIRGRLVLDATVRQRRHGVDGLFVKPNDSVAEAAWVIGIAHALVLCLSLGSWINWATGPVDSSGPGWRARHHGHCTITSSARRRFGLRFSPTRARKHAKVVPTGQLTTRRNQPLHEHQRPHRGHVAAMSLVLPPT
ncbi:MAG: DUF3375 family protein [Planctomycetia bacterium]|nr:DUF3375 family protein [Planctomycetia bacterium]